MQTVKIYKITEASEYIGVSIKSFSTTGKHRRFRQEDLDSYMGVEKVKEKIQSVESDGI